MYHFFLCTAVASLPSTSPHMCPWLDMPPCTLQAWPSMGSNAQGASNGTPSAAMYGASPGGQQAGYGTGQDLFSQSSAFTTPGAYGAFGQQQAGYGRSQVPFPHVPTCLLHTVACICKVWPCRLRILLPSTLYKMALCAVYRRHMAALHKALEQCQAPAMAMVRQDLHKEECHLTASQPVTFSQAKSEIQAMTRSAKCLPTHRTQAAWLSL